MVVSFPASFAKADASMLPCPLPSPRAAPYPRMPSATATGQSRCSLNGPACGQLNAVMLRAVSSGTCVVQVPVLRHLRASNCVDKVLGLNHLRASHCVDKVLGLNHLRASHCVDKVGLLHHLRASACVAKRLGLDQVRASTCVDKILVLNHLILFPYYTSIDHTSYFMNVK